jgi:phage FluMu protein Com
MNNDAYAEQFVPEVKRVTRLKVRCGNCGRLLAERVTAPWTIKCSRCKCINESASSAPVDRPFSDTATQRVAAARRMTGNRTT